MYSAFIHSSFLGSNVAADGVTRLERELRDQLVEREDLAIVLGAPAEQREIVDDRGRKIPSVAVLLDRDRPVPFRELAAARTEHDREMRVDRRLDDAERAPQRQHPVRGVDEILAAQHVGDPHFDVVERIGEKEDGGAVRADDHEVWDGRPLDRDLAADDVGERAAALVGSTKADRARLARRDVRLAFGPGEAAAPAVVAGRAALTHRLLVTRLDIVLGAEAFVREPRVDEPLRTREIVVEPGALEIRTLVPLHAEPAQHLLDLVDRLLRRARDIGVLDAQDEYAADVTRVEIVEQHRAHIADVQEARRRGREPQPRCRRRRARRAHIVGVSRTSGSRSDVTRARHASMPSFTSLPRARSNASETPSTTSRRRRVLVRGSVHHLLTRLDERRRRRPVVAEQRHRQIDVVDDRRAAEKCGALGRDLGDDRDGVVEILVRTQAKAPLHPLRERVRVADVWTRGPEQVPARLLGPEITRPVGTPARRGRQRDARREILLLAGPRRRVGRHERISRHDAPLSRSLRRRIPASRTRAAPASSRHGFSAPLIAP